MYATHADKNKVCYKCSLTAPFLKDEYLYWNRNDKKAMNRLLVKQRRGELVHPGRREYILRRYLMGVIQRENQLSCHTPS
jgi:hypothetical protein